MNKKKYPDIIEPIRSYTSEEEDIFKAGREVELDELRKYLDKLGKYKIMTSEMLRKFYDKRLKELSK